MGFFLSGGGGGGEFVEGKGEAWVKREVGSEWE